MLIASYLRPYDNVGAVGGVLIVMLLYVSLFLLIRERKAAPYLSTTHNFSERVTLGLLLVVALSWHVAPDVVLASEPFGVVTWLVIILVLPISTAVLAIREKLRNSRIV